MRFVLFLGLIFSYFNVHASNLFCGQALAATQDSSTKSAAPCGKKENLVYDCWALKRPGDHLGLANGIPRVTICADKKNESLNVFSADLSERAAYKTSSQSGQAPTGNSTLTYSASTIDDITDPWRMTYELVVRGRRDGHSTFSVGSGIEKVSATYRCSNTQIPSPIELAR